MINNLHHFEILTNSSQKLLNYFINGFKFKLVLSRETEKYQQYLINSNSMNFLITSPKQSKSNANKLAELTNDRDHEQIIALDTIESRDQSLFNLIASKTNTVFNAAFQVKDLDRILFNCERFNVPIIKPKHRLVDEFRSRNGHVHSAMIKSCIDGVVHSLFDLNDYKGSFLPGYERAYADKKRETKQTTTLATHFDHLTYATNKNESMPIIEWYRNIFNMRRFKIDREENGLIVRTGKSGMNIKAINYWLCGETGIELSESSSRDFKFVISEPLDNDNVSDAELGSKNSDEQKNGKNQISIFLEEHDGPGIQHIGLHTTDIVKSVQTSKLECNNVKYYQTPDSYYTNEEKLDEIKECGLNVDMLQKNHILIDSEFSQVANETPELSSKLVKNSYLLQVFTQPIFDKNTLFLELIQRVGDSQGFGAANIKALWNAVQLDINSRMNAK